ncbi:MAG TPA: bifunctional oligoribonuclease/PAP phosphatase NrnA [Clostridiales bacterium]|jgi:phosphoesterase RecJ-like protein|nr:bifunctional oligoribonuclease/PAP phosphatase NrnA [Clostridiales bacterium]HCS11299.1 bifunctional oligoribonuclease/PAP phosphatase NrnA [Clostridiales bacterium]
MKIMLKNDVKEIFNLINTSDKICIAGHKAPDGDCIGSVMALYNFLKPLNKNITVMMDGIIPYNYKAFTDESVILKNYNNEEYDLLFVLDTSDRKRLGKFEDVLNNSKKTVVIDHHKTNEGFGDINIIDTEMSSTGELLYDVLKASDLDISIEAAVLIYVAVLTDTGKFSYTNTTSHTHRKAAELIDLGVNVSEIDNIVYNSKPSNIVKAFIDCVSGIELYYDNKLGITAITKSILDKNNAEMADVDGVVEYIREIKEVEVSCVLKENDEGTKVSLRSKNDIDVSAVSVKYKGGGHAKAAGFDLNENVENARRIIIEEFKEYFV